MKLAVLHLCSEKGWRGGENQIRLLAEAMAEKQIPCFFSFRRGSEAEKRLGPNFPHLSLTFKSWSLAFDAIRLVHYCYANEINVLDAHSSRSHTLALAAKILFPQLKIVVHRRVDYLPTKLWATRLKYLSRGVDCYVAISYAIRRILEQVGVSSHKIFVVRSAVDGTSYLKLDKSNCRETWNARLKLTPKQRLMVCAAALTEQKAIDILLRAVHLLPENVKEGLHVIIAGTGILETELKTLCKNLDLDSFVSFVGFINNVQELIVAADYFVLPSRDEGLGTVLLEAAFGGACIIASNAGGIPEIVRNGKTGYLFEKNNPESLAECIINALGNEENSRLMAKNALSQVREVFNLQSMINGNLTIYNSLFSGKK